MNTETPEATKQPAILGTVLKPDYSVGFFRDGKQIGRFDFNQTPATFVGDVNECAQLFVNEVLRILDERRTI